MRIPATLTNCHAQGERPEHDQDEFERKECDATPAAAAAATSYELSGEGKVEVKTEPKPQEIRDSDGPTKTEPKVPGAATLNGGRRDDKGGLGHSSRAEPWALTTRDRCDATLFKACAGFVAEATRNASAMTKAFVSLEDRTNSLLEAQSTPPVLDPELKDLDLTHSENIRRNRSAARMIAYLQMIDLCAEDFDRFEDRVKQLRSSGAVTPLETADAPESIAYVKFAKKRQQIVLPLCKPFVCMLGIIPKDQLTPELMLGIYRLLLTAGASSLVQRRGAKPGGYSQYTMRRDGTWNFEWYMGQMQKQGAFEKVLAVRAVCRRAYLCLCHQRALARHTRKQERLAKACKEKVAESHNQFGARAEDLSLQLQRLGLTTEHRARELDEIVKREVAGLFRSSAFSRHAERHHRQESRD